MDLLGAAVLALLVVAVLAATEWLGAHRRLPPEVLRKFAHVGSGGAVLVAPALCRSRWPLVVLAAGFAAVLACAARFGCFPALHRVRRRSAGSVWFPLGVLLLAVLFWERRAAFLAGALVLTFGDALAALAGEVGGRHRYRIAGNTRSLEGSLVLFAVALAAVTVLLVVRGEAPVTQALPLAATVALLATAVEAVSPGGSDNLALPLVTAAVTAHLLGS